MGAVTIATAGAECKKPRDLGRAMVWAGLTFLTVYTLAQLVVEGSVPWQELGMDVSPFTYIRLFTPENKNTNHWYHRNLCNLSSCMHHLNRKS